MSEISIGRVRINKKKNSENFFSAHIHTLDYIRDSKCEVFSLLFSFRESFELFA